MLYLWMPEANGVWRWSRGENWTACSSIEQLIQDLQIKHHEEAVVYFPSREIQIIQQPLSKAQYKQLGVEGVKYLLEEYVILPIDQMHVRSHFQAPGLLTILGISQHAVLTMQHALSLIPVKVTALLPDFLILPEPIENEVVLVNVEGQLLVREHAYKGSSVDDLALYLDIAPQVERYRYADLTAAQLDSLASLTTAEQREHAQYRFVPTPKAKQHPFNVLPKAKNSEQGISGYWKAAAWVFATLLVIQFSYDLLRWAKLKQVANQTAQISIDQYQSWFGRNGRVSEQNIKSLFESNLRLSQAANTQALQLISRIGPILMQQQIVAQRVNYDASMLNLDLIARSSDQLQSLVSQLNQQGFKAELGNIQTQGESVVGMVKVQ